MRFPFYQSKDLLGINRRNADYILPKNPRRLYPFVDDKLQTKELLEANGIPTPELYFAVLHPFELRFSREKLLTLNEVAIKPARGSGGRGIMVLVARKGDKWEKSNGELVSLEDIEYHVSNILAGLYSLGGTDDWAFAEYFIHSHGIFNNISYQGVPDIRIIIYKGVPFMTMLRLPTKESGGKANLHQGAIGVGVDMRTGITTTGVHGNRPISEHPDTGMSISGVEIPFWEELLTISARIYDIFELGYVGVDFAIDRSKGPMILELNARPGLNIQLANQKGLRSRLAAVDVLLKDKTHVNLAERLKIARTIFEM